MKTMVKQFARHTDGMKTPINDYFEVWQHKGNGNENKRLLQLSEELSAGLGEIYEKTAENRFAVTDLLKTYLTDAKKNLIYLNNVLTNNNIEATIPNSGKADNKKYKPLFANREYQGRY